MDMNKLKRKWVAEYNPSMPPSEDMRTRPLFRALKSSRDATIQNMEYHWQIFSICDTLEQAEDAIKEMKALQK